MKFGLKKHLKTSKYKEMLNGQHHITNLLWNPINTKNMALLPKTVYRGQEYILLIIRHKNTIQEVLNTLQFLKSYLRLHTDAREPLPDELRLRWPPSSTWRECCSRPTGLGCACSSLERRPVKINRMPSVQSNFILFKTK